MRGSITPGWPGAGSSRAASGAGIAGSGRAAAPIAGPGNAVRAATGVIPGAAVAVTARAGWACATAAPLGGPSSCSAAPPPPRTIRTAAQNQSRAASPGVRRRLGGAVGSPLSARSRVSGSPVAGRPSRAPHQRLLQLEVGARACSRRIRASSPAACPECHARSPAGRCAAAVGRGAALVLDRVVEVGLARRAEMIDRSVARLLHLDVRA